MSIVLISDFVTSLQVESLGPILILINLLLHRMASDGRSFHWSCFCFFCCFFFLPLFLISTVIFCLSRWDIFLTYYFHPFSSLSVIPIPWVVKLCKNGKHISQIKSSKKKKAKRFCAKGGLLPYLSYRVKCLVRGIFIDIDG